MSDTRSEIVLPGVHARLAEDARSLANHRCGGFNLVYVRCAHAYEAVRMKTRALGLIVVCGVAVDAGAQATSAQSPNFSVTVTESEDVVVQTGTRQTVERADIDRRNARTLNDALTLLPGIRVRSGGDGRPLVDFRGLRSRHVLLLLDGVPLNSTTDGQFDAALIPTESIQAPKTTR